MKPPPEKPVTIVRSPMFSRSSSCVSAPSPAQLGGVLTSSSPLSSPRGGAGSTWRVCSFAMRGFAAGRCGSGARGAIFGIAPGLIGVVGRCGATSLSSACRVTRPAGEPIDGFDSCGAFATAAGFGCGCAGLACCFCFSSSSIRKITLFSSRISSLSWIRSSGLSVCVAAGPSRSSRSYSGTSCGSPMIWRITVASFVAVNTGEYACRKRSRSVAKSPAV